MAVADGGVIADPRRIGDLARTCAKGVPVTRNLNNL